MEEQEHWQLDGTAPELYERYLVPAITAMWAADLADRVALCPGERVLDVACGNGIMARVAAENIGVTGTVDALDINRGMLAIARSLPPDDPSIDPRRDHGSTIVSLFCRPVPALPGKRPRTRRSPSISTCPTTLAAPRWATCLQRPKIGRSDAQSRLPVILEDDEGSTTGQLTTCSLALADG